MIAEVAHRNRRRVWNCLPKQVHAGCLDYAAVVTCPAFATTLENGRFDKCHGASRMSEKRREAAGEVAEHHLWNGARGSKLNLCFLTGQRVFPFRHQ